MVKEAIEAQENKVSLLKLLRSRVVADEVLKNGQDVLAVADDALKQRTQLGIAPGFPVPFGQDGRGNFNVAAKFFGRVASQKQPIEEGRFPLRELKVLHCLFGRRARGNRRIG